MGPDPDPNDPTPGMHIWGWMSPAELTWLGEQAAQMSSVVEVGSLHGRSAFALLTACSGPVYCIDPWDDAGGFCYPSFMGACGHFENVRPVRGRSPRVARKIPNVEMVFIDGAHDYPDVVADIQAWLPKTRRLICGHDYYPDIAAAGFPGVPTAVNELFEGRFTVADGTTIWAVWVDR